MPPFSGARESYGTTPVAAGDRALTPASKGLPFTWTTNRSRILPFLSVSPEKVIIEHEEAERVDVIAPSSPARPALEDQRRRVIDLAVDDIDITLISFFFFCAGDMELAGHLAERMGQRHLLSSPSGPPWYVTTNVSFTPDVAPGSGFALRRVDVVHDEKWRRVMHAVGGRNASGPELRTSVPEIPARAPRLAHHSNSDTIGVESQPSPQI